MKIISLYINNFGKLSNFKYDFKDGINCLYKENGWGKTTLSIFIKSMLYGLSSTTSYDLEKNDRKKFLPWNNLCCGGYLIIETNNKQYKIERTFGKKAKDDTCVVYDLLTNKVSDEFNENIGEQLLNLNASSFERSVFIPQKELSIEFDGDIASKLSDLIGGTNDTSNYDQAIEKLDKQIKELKKNGNKGLINEYKERLKNTEENIDACLQKINKIPELENEILDIEQQIENDTIKRNEARTSLNTYNLILQKITKKETLAKYEEDIMVSKNKINGYKKSINNLELNKEELERIKLKNKEYENLKHTIKQEKNIEDYQIIEENTFNILDEKINKYSQLKNQKPSLFKSVILPIIYIILMVVTLVFIISYESFRPIGLIFISIYLISIVLITSSRFKNKKNKYVDALEKEIREIFAKYNMFDSNFEDNLIELKYLNRKHIEDIKLNDIEKQENLEKIEKTKLLDYEISVFLNKYLLNGDTYDEKISELDKVNTLIVAENENLNRLINIKEEFIKNNDLSDVNDISNYDINQLNNLIDEYEINISNSNNLKQTKIVIKNEFEKQNEVLEDYLCLKEELVATIKELTYKLDVYCKTKELLTISQDRLLSKYVKPMKDKLSKYFDKLLNNKNDFSINTDFEISLIENGQNKEVGYYSKGYQQIISLCMRFALIDCLYTKEKPFVILDDSFVNFDEDKLTLCKDLLNDISKDLQIIYFTCHESRIL